MTPWSTMLEEIDEARDRRDPRFADCPDNELERQLRLSAGDIAAATARWLLLVAEFVARGLWADQGAKSPAHWLSWAVGMDERTARDHVRVALRLHEFPRTTEQFLAGRLSYSKVRAITRSGRPQLEEMLLTYAEVASGGQLERIVRHLRQLSRQVDGPHVPLTPWEQADTSLRDHGDGMSTISLRMPTDEAVRVWSVLQRGAEEKHRQARRAGALPRGVEDPVDAADLTAEAAERDAPVRVRVGEGERRAAISSRVLRRLACTAKYAVVGHGSEPGVSGSTSVVPPRLRRLLHDRDRTCRFPGCGTASHLDAHHIHHVADCGATELSNLVLLCRFHHSYVHTNRWSILHDGLGHVRFRPPGGRPLAPSRPLRGSAEPRRGLSPHGSAEPRHAGPGADMHALEAHAYSDNPDYSECVGLLLEEIQRQQAPDPPVAAAA